MFIDLAFVLLVGFLILTETNPRMNVALPGDPEVESTSDDIGPTIFNLYFDEAMRFLLEDSRFLLEDSLSAACTTTGLEATVACMAEVIDSLESTVFILIPQGSASVQQMVAILDVCYYHDWNCTVQN